MMKTLSFVWLMVLACTVFALSARGDEPSDPQVPNAPQEIKLTPEMQAKLAQLLKTLGNNQADAPVPSAPAPATPTPATPAPATPAPSGTAPVENIDATKLAPMISQLLKMLNSDSGDLTDDSKPAAHSEPAPTPANGQKSQQTSAATGLQTTSLHSGSLVTGTLNGAPRMTKEQWRALFPSQH